MADPAPAPGLLHEDPEIHRRRWFLLGVMCLSLVLVVMSVSGLNVALPSLQRELGATASDLQWIVDAYGLVFAGLLLSAGAIGDRFGRRRALLIGLVVFGLGALVGGLAQDATVVIAGRSVMGIGAAFIMPATLSLIATIFPPDERRRAIAIWAGFAGAGGAIGPLVSGGLLDSFWWGSALLVNVPIVGVILVVISVVAPESRDPGATPLDPVGALFSLVGLGALVFGIIEGPDQGWTSPEVLAGFAVAALGLGAFLRWEHRAEHPMLPLPLFRDRRFSVGSGVITTNFFVMFGFFFLTTQYLQFVRGYSPLLAGAATLPFAFTLVLVSPRSALLAERFGAGPVIATGFCFSASGFAVLGTVAPTSAYVELAAAFVLLGVGMGIAVAPATGNIISSVPSAKAGIGSAVNDTTRELGGALGIAVLGSIVNAGYRAAVDLGGLALPPAAAARAADSVGEAARVAASLPDGAALAHRAGVAFTDAYNLSCLVSVGVVLLGSLAVATTFRPRVEQAAEAAARDRGDAPEARAPTPDE